MKNPDHKKNFFSKLTIIKANFKATLIATLVLILYTFIIGITLYTNSSSQYKFSHQIDQTCFKNKCQIRFILKEDQNGPFYVYVKYKDFYLNHRNIAFSVDWGQINGGSYDSGNPNARCKGYSLNEDGVAFYPGLFEKKNKGEIMNPCGLFSLLYVKCFLIR